MEKDRERLRCGGCGRKMYQCTPQNRDYQGLSWHYECLSNACGSMREFYESKWADDHRKHGWKTAWEEALEISYEFDWEKEVR